MACGSFDVVHLSPQKLFKITCHFGAFLFYVKGLSTRGCPVRAGIGPRAIRARQGQLRQTAPHRLRPGAGRSDHRGCQRASTTSASTTNTFLRLHDLTTKNTTMTNPPPRIYNWLDGRLSIARFAGSISINGVTYVVATHEEGQPLVGQDVLAAEAKKEGAKK